MKKFISLIAFSILATAQAFAGDVEPGLYFAQDVESGDIKAQIQLNEDNTAGLRLSAGEYLMPAPGCMGSYKVEGSLLSATMACPDFGTINVTLDTTNITPESVRSEEGALVNVTLDLIGNDPLPFRVKKIDKPVFPQRF